MASPEPGCVASQALVSTASPEPGCVALQALVSTASLEPGCAQPHSNRFH